MNLSEILSIVGALCSVIPFISAIIMKWIKFEHKREWFYAAVFITICVSSLGAIVLMFVPISKDYLFVWSICLILSLLSLILYANNAINSLDEDPDHVLPPKMLWQMLLNKIPANVHNSDETNVKFAVVSMDDCDEIIGIRQRIGQSYKQQTKISVLLVDGFTRRKKNGQIIVADLNKVLNDDSIRGVIFLVGISGDNGGIKQVKNAIERYAERHKSVPIAYCRAGNKTNFKLNYERISLSKIDDFARHLIMRGYYRNKMQFNLGASYHKTFIVQIILIIVLFISMLAFGKRVYENNSLHHQLSASENKIDSLTNKVHAYYRPKALIDDLYETKQNNSYIKYFDLNSFKKDSSMVKILKDYSDYYFSDLNSVQNVKIWYRPDKKEDSLKCIFRVKEKGSNNIPVDNYLMGSVVTYRLFVLWPGEASNGKFDPDKKYVWLYNGDQDIVNDSGVKGHWIMENRRWEGEIKIDGKYQPIIIPWYSKQPDDGFGVLGFSYDGLLALELDLTPSELTNDYNYISHLMFRNSVRKFMKVVGDILNHPKYDKRFIQDR